MAKRVLVCDDDEGILDVIKMLLCDKGYEVKVVSQGQQFMGIVRKFKPDLIILDLWMPGIAGEELLVRLKNGSGMRKVPVVLISAQRELSQRARDMGADGYLAKPFDIEAFEKMVASFLTPPSP